MPGPQLTLVNFRKGAYIIVEGKQQAAHFYIIRSGKVQIKREVEVQEEDESNILVPGDFFGVVSTMSSHSHIESAIALSDVSLIAVERDQLPETAPDEYYWTDLEGLSVVCQDGTELGRIDHLLETGANDVLVVQGERERLIPYIPGQVIRQVDLENGRMVVDWDPEF